MKSLSGSSDTEAYVFLISLFSSSTSSSTSTAIAPPRISVAEDGSAFADPFPERGRAGQACIRYEAALVQLAGLEADRTDEQLAAAVRVLLKQLRERRTAVAGDRLRVPGQSQPDRLLGKEHRHLLAALERRAPDEERNRHALGVLEPGCEVDHDLLVVRHHRSLQVVGIGGDALLQLLSQLVRLSDSQRRAAGHIGQEEVGDSSHRPRRSR